MAHVKLHREMHTATSSDAGGAPGGDTTAAQTAAATDGGNQGKGEGPHVCLYFDKHSVTLDGRTDNQSETRHPTSSLRT